MLEIIPSGQKVTYLLEFLPILDYKDRYGSLLPPVPGTCFTVEGVFSLILPKTRLIFHLPLKSDSPILCGALAVVWVKSRYFHLNRENMQSNFPALYRNICKMKQQNTSKH